MSVEVEDKKALDELFIQVKTFRKSTDFKGLLTFIKRFRFYSPYNAMLIQIQMPGATFVATPRVWLKKYKRTVKPNTRPIVILQTMGPVMFVFDVSDTEPLPGAPALPTEVTNPFDIPAVDVEEPYIRTVSNAIRDGVEVATENAGSQLAGSILPWASSGQLKFQVRVQPKESFVDVPKRYHLSLNAKTNTAGRYVTLVHELAHLYCGHLGSPNEKWWPSRRGLNQNIREFEAETVAHLVCIRKGIDSKSDAYLSGYLEKNDEIPDISLDLVLKTAGLIERMGRERLKKR
ncbi:hypothetical protein [Desulfonatronum parangueonense]